MFFFGCAGLFGLFGWPECTGWPCCGGDQPVVINLVTIYCDFPFPSLDYKFAALTKGRLVRIVLVVFIVIPALLAMVLIFPRAIRVPEVIEITAMFSKNETIALGKSKLK